MLNLLISVTAVAMYIGITVFMGALIGYSYFQCKTLFGRKPGISIFHAPYSRDPDLLTEEGKRALRRRESCSRIGIVAFLIVMSLLLLMLGLWGFK